MRREYVLINKVVINEISISRVIIDPHYEAKHSTSITDEVILNLVRMLDGGNFTPVGINPPYSYYRGEHLVLENKFYRMVWVLEDQKNYIGIINTHRR